ncbi:hypothetical protein HPB48_008983 [Haemaphysalis longicornis]|uniref:Uncharacterized protein n=1 Tax=Haemaphysalis longicornis TaxID=44386 RepID=A0A9J6H1B0_HAELO|nr:hypothetical protein HPB48_008983 [Haemaphysalis longicornis]
MGNSAAGVRQAKCDWGALTHSSALSPCERLPVTPSGVSVVDCLWSLGVDTAIVAPVTVHQVAAACCLAVAMVLLLSEQPTGVSAVHLAYLGNTTACEICDLDVDFSGRNFICCLAHSKCCG